MSFSEPEKKKAVLDLPFPFWSVLKSWVIVVQVGWLGSFFFLLLETSPKYALVIHCWDGQEGIVTA